MKYIITTFGCQMNVHESEKLAGVLSSFGFVETEDEKEADVIVFNTCAIREGAEDRAFGNIGALKQLKAKNKNTIIAVCGCMTQQKEASDVLYKTFPFIDIIFGTHNLYKFEEFLKERIETKKRVFKLTEEETVPENFKIHRTSGKNAWVNIMYGCNNFCSYCIVPYVRGRERSRKKEDILSEIKNLAMLNEYDKITLLGQNVNSYGKDIYNEYGFTELLNDICAIDGNFKLTFMTSHPKDLTNSLIETIANQPKILKELHLPVQSGSDKILKAMNRNYTIESYLKKIEYLKKLIPNVRLTTDIIVGFPGETEEDFKLSLELLSKIKFSGIFAFMYSIRRGTAAEKLENHIDDKIKNKRVNEILNFQKQFNN